MKSINHQLLSLCLVLSAAALTACGGGSGSSSEGTSKVDKTPEVDSSKDVLTFNLFDSQIYIQAGDAIKRIQWTYQTGDRQLKQKNIVNDNNRGILDNNDEIVLGDHFEGLMSKKNIKVQGNTIKFLMQDNVSNKSATYSIELIPINLEGVTAKDGNLEKDTGLITDLTLYDKIPDTVSFPTGSLCYVPKYNSSMDFYKFSSQTDVTNFSTIEAWKNTYLDKHRTVIRTESTQVGSSNQYPAERIVYDADPNNESHNYNAVDYKGTIYSAEYTPKGEHHENDDLQKGVVYCAFINDVAADFLEQQFVKYYR